MISNKDIAMHINIPNIKNLTISYFVVGITQGIFWIGYGLNISDIVVYGPNITIYILFTIYLNVVIYVKARYNLFYITNIPLAILCYFSCSYFPSSINESLHSPNTLYNISSLYIFNS